mgnify:CR=1 FL=1
MLHRLLENRNLPFTFLQSSLFQKWAIAVILCMIIALVMAPDINLSEPQYKVGMIAAKNIKADHAFLVEDKQATEQKIYEDAENIKPVYNYSKSVEDNIKTKLLNSFTVAQENHKKNVRENKLSGNIDTNTIQKEKKVLEFNLGIYLSPEEFYILNENKFSRELQQKLSRLVITFYNNKYITSEILGKSEKEKGIVIRKRTLQLSDEMINSSQLYNIQEIDDVLQRTVSLIFKGEDKALKDVAFSITKKLIEPNITFNKEATEKKKMAVMGEANPTFFQVQKNEMIVREGEKIGYLELAKLNAYLKDTRENKLARLTVMLGFFLTAMFLSVVLYL